MDVSIYFFIHTLQNAFSDGCFCSYAYRMSLTLFVNEG